MLLAGFSIIIRLHQTLTFDPRLCFRPQKPPPRPTPPRQPRLLTPKPPRPPSRPQVRAFNIFILSQSKRNASLCLKRPPSAAVATSPPSDSVCDFDHGLCGWMHDPDAPLLWSLHSHGESPHQSGSCRIPRRRRCCLVSRVSQSCFGELEVGVCVAGV